MSKMKHSNIVEFIGACMTPPNLCFVMEMCETSLYKLLHVEHETFTDREVLQMAIDVACAMEYLHARKPSIIHRDLKSHNVLRSFNGALKLCDFGLVRCRNTRAGTPAYMAPELIEGKSFNRSVDVYAFAIMLNEMFSSRVPFSGVPLDDMRDRVVQGERPAIATWTDSRCLAIIQSCWSDDPSDRMEFTAIVDELSDILDNTNSKSNVDAVKLSHDDGDALDILLTGRK